MNGRSVVLITGGAAGIGLCIAETFLHAGYQVHVCDADAAAVERFEHEQADAGASITDIAEAEQVDALFSEVRDRYSALHILVNNAGIADPTARVEDIEPADWARTVAIDLNGQFYCAVLG